MKIAEIKKLADAVEGWLADEEGLLLYELAKNCRGTGVIVEIGSWKGKSAIWLGHGSKNGNNIKVYAVDPHTGSNEHHTAANPVWTFDEFETNITRAGLVDLITPLVQTSAQAAKDFARPVELIFVDGAHEYQAVKLDLDLWFPHVVDGGIMAFHDTTRFSGASQVVEKFIYKSKHFRAIRLVHSTTVAQKVRHNSLGDRLRNRYILLLKKLYELTAIARLPASVRGFGKRLFQSIQ